MDMLCQAEGSRVALPRERLGGCTICRDLSSTRISAALGAAVLRKEEG